MRGLYPLLIVVILLIAGIGYSYFQTTPPDSKPSDISPAANQTSSAFCSPSDLQSTLEFSGAAGNIYGNLTIKNISDKTCDILGSNFVNATFEAKNITLTQQGTAGPAKIVLDPGQTVYSQVRYQNGPQCSSAIKTSPVQFIYNISSSSFVTFKNPNGSATQNITTCTNPTENTQVTTWNISTQPISP